MFARKLLSLAKTTEKKAETKLKSGIKTAKNNVKSGAKELKSALKAPNKFSIKPIYKGKGK